MAKPCGPIKIKRGNGTRRRKPGDPVIITRPGDKRC